MRSFIDRTNVRAKERRRKKSGEERPVARGAAS
jgi:hypothetical protein